jgi:hypothetical protein
MGRRICLVGYSPKNRDWGNEQDDDVEIWTITEAAKFLLRADRHFQVHDRQWRDVEHYAKAKKKKGVFIAPNTFGRGPQAIDMMQKLTVPLYMNFPEPEFPTAVKFPLRAVANRYGKLWFGKRQPYLTSTIAYMAALALLEHDRARSKKKQVDEILLAGIELSQGTEYYDQRPCFEYYLGIAVGRGIKVTLPPSERYGSSILGAPVYPLEEPLARPHDFVSEPGAFYLDMTGISGNVKVAE